MNGNYFAQKDKAVSGVRVKMKKLRAYYIYLIYCRYHSLSLSFSLSFVFRLYYSLRTIATQFIECLVQKQRYWPLFHFYHAILFAFSIENSTNIDIIGVWLFSLVSTISLTIYFHVLLSSFLFLGIYSTVCQSRNI